MPHIRVEITDNINIDHNRLLTAINRTLTCSGEFYEADIKSRVVTLHHYLAGNDASAGFVHCQLELMAGRSDAIKSSLAKALLDTLTDHMPKSTNAIQSSVHVTELNPACYTKAIFYKQDMPNLRS